MQRNLPQTKNNKTERKHSMNPSIQFKPRIPRNSIYDLLLTALALTCFALLPPKSFGVVPAPGGGYAGFNTAEGQNALFSLTTGIDNTALGGRALFHDTVGNNNTAVGLNALFNNIGGSDNTALGTTALLHNTGSLNTATGFQALLSNTTGNFNTANGVNALMSNTTGSLNTANGFNALLKNTTGVRNTANGVNVLVNSTGSDNTATGVAALFTNATGFQNTANGVGALLSNTTGSNNTASGFQALLSNIGGLDNTADGFQALFNNTTGTLNTANGVQALLSNTTGNENTANGFGALGNNTTGNSNIALGVDAGFNLTTGSGNIDIGNAGAVGESATIRIGEGQTRTFIGGIRGVTTGNANAVNVVIDSDGQLGTTSSSRRFKKEIKPMDQASEAILALKPVTFHYKNDNRSTPQFGLIAEEVADVNPDLVVRDKNGEIYTVRYDAVNAMLLNEFLKEHRRVQDLEVAVAQQQKGIEVLTAQFKKQARQIQRGRVQIGVNKPAARVVLNSQ
jgi:hypothetical protein